MRQFAELGSNATRARGAFTLIELLLVLCLLVIAATMAWPKLTGVVAGQRLRSGADQVRVAWYRARVQAMSKGQIVLFRFVSNGNQFRLESRASDESVDQDPTDGTSGSARKRAAPRPSPGQLPRGVQFAGVQAAADSRDARGPERPEPAADFRRRRVVERSDLLLSRWHHFHGADRLDERISPTH